MEESNWNKGMVELHERAARLLEKVCFDLFLFLGDTAKSVTEYEACRFIQTSYDRMGLVSDVESPIVAFRESTSWVHYFADSGSTKELKRESLVMVDLWAAIKEPDAPYADMTWMAYRGERIPDQVMKSYDIVIQARDKAVEWMRGRLSGGVMPTGKEVDDAARSVFEREGLLKHFPHTTGHSLGFGSPHGKLPGINQRNTMRLLKNVGYTIEPGLYFPGNFGIRSEIDFYVNDEYELVITTPVQREMTRVG